MRKAIIITLIAALSIFCLQWVWVDSTRKLHEESRLKQIDKILVSAIQEEVSLRIKHTKAQDTTVFTFNNNTAAPLEKIDTQGSQIIRLEDKEITSLQEITFQALQDKLIETIPLRLSILDSIFNDKLRQENIVVNYSILSYNEDKEIIGSTGTLPPGSKRVLQTEMKPIGTQGLQFITVILKVPMTDLMRNMLMALFTSVIIMVIVLGCIVFQLTIIRRKDSFLKKREAGVTGTIHELKSPLNSVITMLSWLKGKETNEPKIQMINLAAASTNRMVGKIEALLVTAKHEQRRMFLQKDNVNIAGLAEAAIEEIREQFFDKPHKTEIVNNLTNPVVRVDRLYTGHAIRNLLENALRYSDDNVKIIVTLSETGKFVNVSVKDNGWGIEKRYRRKLFDQFYQVPRTGERMVKGHGIGLSYVRHIVEAHGGKVNVNSIEGKGSTFIISLPR